MSLQCSVIVPTYNRVTLLRYTLDSLVGQTLPREEFEVLVVDDGSTDDTRAVVESYADRLNVRYFFQDDEGYRVAKARNVGIVNATADICVFVDSGVLLHAGALAAHLDTHRQAAEPVAVVGYVYCFNEDNEDGAQIIAAVDPADPTASIDRFAADQAWLDIREEFYRKYGDDIDRLPAPWLVYWMCNTSARRADLLRAGLLDEAFRKWGAEDVDLSYRMHRGGVRFVLNRRASSLHYPHAKSYADNMASVAGNYDYFARKYGTPIAGLVVGNHFFDINDFIRDDAIPACLDYLAALPPRVLVVAPHPDDDVIACGGTIAQKAQAGDRVELLVVTDGSMSHQAVLGLDEPTPAELTTIRQGEAVAAAARLGVPADNVTFLGFPDTAVRDVVPDLRMALLAYLSARPDLAEIYVPHDVRELNADHRLTGETVLSALSQLELTPRVRKYVVWDEQTEEEFVFVNREPAESDAGAGESLVSVDIMAERETKLAALREHHTQVDLYSPAQTRPVVPAAFVKRVCDKPTEDFWE